jgi:CubicO group peptidase (beta-lactamase class C family)
MSLQQTDLAFTPRPGAAWDSMAPDAAGFDRARLQQAIDFHLAHESGWPRSMYFPDGRYVGVADIGDRAEHAAVVGPVRPRGAPNGLILRGGRLVAEWGDTNRPDMTFSISKSYLALLAGLALEDGLISSLDHPVGQDVPGPWFASAHNAAITWRHLLQQTSEWEGELWGKPDSADHNRVVGGAAAPAAGKGEKRVLARPGAHFEYNDVRVNLLAACLTQRFGRALPDVLKERVMDPIGASATWEWHGYDNAFIDLNGRRIHSVSGGGHWGGGMMIGSRDHARIGLLVQRDGVWNGRRILPAGWVGEMMAPSPCNPQYGLLWWLNANGALRYPSATAGSFFAMGAGVNLIWIAPELDMVVVARWIERDQVDPFMGLVRDALAT